MADQGYTVGNTTYAGFEPSAATRNTDTTDPSAGAKDWLYRYLLQNPNTGAGWSQTAADALNSQYGTSVFKPIDGETLGYGDEFVHSAPNGYGLTNGQYDPSAKGEFFWGATGQPATGSPAPTLSAPTAGRTLDPSSLSALFQLLGGLANAAPTPAPVGGPSAPGTVPPMSYGHDVISNQMPSSAPLTPSPSNLGGTVPQSLPQGATMSDQDLAALIQRALAGAQF